MRRGLWISVAGTTWVMFATITLVAQAQITPVSGGYLFRKKYVKGEKQRLLMTTIGSVGESGKGIPSTVENILEVLEVKGKSARVRSTVGAATVAGKTTSKGQQSELTVDERGKMIGTTGGGVSNFVFPEKPIRIGQTFTDTMQTGAMGGEVTATYRLLGFKSVKGHKVAELSMSLANGGQVAITGSGKVLVSVADGSTIRLNMATRVLIHQDNRNFVVRSQTTLERKF